MDSASLVAPFVPIDWIELVPGFGCNCRCRVCPSARLQPGPGLAQDELIAWIERGRTLGAHGLWFGGGEPSLRPGLADLIGRARAAGYRDVRLQTNGLRFAYPAYARRLAQAGLTSASLSVKAAEPDLHDRITRVPGSFELLVRAATNLAQLDVDLQADVLITTPALPQLATAVERFADLGCGTFTFWLVSLHGLDPAADAHWLPGLAAVRPHLEAAFERAAEIDARATSLHTPPCCLSPSHRSRYHHAGRYRLLVVTPGQPAFMAEESPMEGGVYVDACQACSVRAECLGLRADYLAAHGPGDIQPVD